MKSEIRKSVRKRIFASYKHYPVVCLPFFFYKDLNINQKINVRHKEVSIVRDYFLKSKRVIPYRKFSSPFHNDRFFKI